MQVHSPNMYDENAVILHERATIDVIFVSWTTTPETCMHKATAISL
jgi:hypothetical protein